MSDESNMRPVAIRGGYQPKPASSAENLGYQPVAQQPQDSTPVLVQNPPSGGTAIQPAGSSGASQPNK